MAGKIIELLVRFDYFCFVKLVTLSFLLSLVAFSFAQTVTVEGICVDKKGKPLIDVKISLENDPSIALTTNEKGRYVFQKSFGDTLFLVYQYQSFTEKESSSLTDLCRNSYQRCFSRYNPVKPLFCKESRTTHLI